MKKYKTNHHSLLSLKKNKIIPQFLIQDTNLKSKPHLMTE
jgi:hypothetical protein